MQKMPMAWQQGLLAVAHAGQGREGLPGSGQLDAVVTGQLARQCLPGDPLTRPQLLQLAPCSLACPLLSCQALCPFRSACAPVFACPISLVDLACSLSPLR